MLSAQAVHQAWQRCAESWQSSAQALAVPAAAGSQEEYVQALCARNISSIARSFLSRVVQDERVLFQQTTEKLLLQNLPPRGAYAVWRQLSSALVASQLWLGQWTPGAFLSKTLPASVLLEMLAIPTELLFCDRALPLADVQLWGRAARTLVEASDQVFALLLADLGGSGALKVLADWLRATRLSFEWLDTDEAVPLRALRRHTASLLRMTEADPGGGCQVAQQLARWVRCDADVQPILQPLLDRLLPLALMPDPPQLLPLLADLAADRWPRACIESQATGLDILAVADATLAFVRSSDTMDAEAALAVWQSFAVTMLNGTTDWEDEAEPGIGRHANWWVPMDQVHGAPALPQLFSRLVQEILRLMRLSAGTLTKELQARLEARSAAQSALAAWAGLVGDSSAWSAATWAPLHLVARQLAVNSPQESLAQEVEVVLWFSFTLAASWPEQNAPAAAVVLEINDQLDSFPPTWRALLWMQACCLASTAPPQLCPRLIEWMLQRPPHVAGANELLEITELPYACSLEMACRQLGNITSEAAAERLLSLAFEVPVEHLHPHSADAKARILRAVRHVVGDNTKRLCDVFGQRILPGLWRASQAEGQTGHLAMRVLIAILHSVLASSSTGHHGPEHPVILLWQEYGQCLEAPLLQLQCNIASDGQEQPLAAAVEVLAAACAEPVLLHQALQLLLRTAQIRGAVGAEACLKALEHVLPNLPCPPLGQSAADAVARVAHEMSEVVLSSIELLQNPAVVKALYSLWNRSLVLAGKPGCGGRLRSAFLGKTQLVERMLGILHTTLPVFAADVLLRWLSLLLPRADAGTSPDVLAVLRQALPVLCGSICRCLSEQEGLTKWDSGFLDAAEFLFLAADVFREDFPAALSAGVQSVDCLPRWSQAQLQQHIERRQQWPTRSAWISALQQIVQDVQRERAQKAT
ncbi:unnamed protein product [Effrenium voratum]|uniref:Uncharacterized protein n=1 Tax=Effrenium voratum TaxID=2562239 RepID=A0AA36I5X0_9DINO|nr:unnamed protein product [Effrenium voratum]CAJ1459729.1 unnamed protein product [Effrenium voratum]